MKLNDYVLPGLTAGFSAGVLSSIPGLKNLCCCLIVPVSSFLAVYLYMKSTGTQNIQLRNTSLIGIITGIFAALFTTSFEVLFTMLTHTNDFVESLPQTEIAVKGWDLGPIFDNTFAIMKQMSKEILQKGFSLIYTIAILFSNLIVDTIFGFAGALAAKSYYNRRITRE